MNTRTALARASRMLRSPGPEQPSSMGSGRVLTGVTLLAMLTTVTFRTGDLLEPTWSTVAVVLVLWSPLLVRTRAPLVSVVAVVLAESLYLAFLVPEHAAGAEDVFGAYQPVPIASSVAVFTAAARFAPRIGWITGLSASTVLLVVASTRNGPELRVTDMLLFNVVLLATGAGVAVSSRRERRRREQVQREEETAQAVLDERLRIARELHDVLAHNLTLVNAQAGVAAYLIEQNPAAATAALKDITAHTGRAIEELRATVGLLRHGDDPTPPGSGEQMHPVPEFADIDRLIESFRSAGSDVRITRHGTPAVLGRQEDLAAYRIVQEALTNATKHAPGSPIHVEVRWADATLALDVVNALPPSTPSRAPAPGTGHGLVGMRERAVAAGGSLTASAGHDEFRVSARLPAAPRPLDSVGDVSTATARPPSENGPA